MTISKEVLDELLKDCERPGPVTELFRSFESILCNKRDFLWDDPEARNFDKKRFALR